MGRRGTPRQDEKTAGRAKPARNEAAKEGLREETICKRTQQAPLGNTLFDNKKAQAGLSYKDRRRKKK